MLVVKWKFSSSVNYKRKNEYGFKIDWVCMCFLPIKELEWCSESFSAVLAQLVEVGASFGGFVHIVDSYQRRWDSHNLVILPILIKFHSA